MPKYFSAWLVVFSAMVIVDIGLLSCITCEGKYPKGSFIFPLVNKSAGIWLIGIGMNAKTVLHRVFRLARRWRRITATRRGVMFALHRKRALAKYDANDIRFQVSIAYKRFSLLICVYSVADNRTYQFKTSFVWAKYLMAEWSYKRREKAIDRVKLNGKLFSKLANYVCKLYRNCM